MGHCISQIVYARSRTLPPPRSAHDRFRRRVSRAAPPASCRPHAGTPLRASPPREDNARQDRLRAPRELARVARPCRATSRRNSAAISSAASSASGSAVLSARAAARGLSLRSRAREVASTRRATVRWLRLTRLLDAAAAADMLAWENSGLSVDASVRITLIDRDVPSYFKSVEHLLRYSARPPFALERLSGKRVPRHKAANWVDPGRGRKSTRPGASGGVEFSPFEFLDRLADLVPPPRKAAVTRIIRLIALITEPGPIRNILTHLGEPLEPPPISPDRLAQVSDQPGLTRNSPIGKRLRKCPWPSCPSEDHHDRLRMAVGGELVAHQVEAHAERLDLAPRNPFER
jgi:hypothetical protein